MAKTPPPLATRFKPGESGNKSGRPKNLLTKDRVSAILSRFSGMTRSELEQVSKDPKATMIELTIGAIFAKAATTGDYSRLEFLLQRSIGKVTEQIDVKQIEPFILTKRDGTQIVAGAKPASEADHDETGDS